MNNIIYKWLSIILLMTIMSAICIYLVYEEREDELRTNILELEHNIHQYEQQLDERQTEIDYLRNKLDTYETHIDELINKNEQLINLLERYKTIVGPEMDKHISRGNFSRAVTMEVTAYDLSYASCQKYPDHPEYGITYSGKRVKEWHTIAADPSIPIGTKIFIPYFKDKPNGGIFVVEDRGGAIKGNRLDVYMTNHSDAMKFGRRMLDVFILGSKENSENNY